MSSSSWAPTRPRTTPAGSNGRSRRFACPAPGAIVQYTNGIVDFNQENCIGCQYCVTGCPFDIPRFDASTRTVSKCNMCVDRVEAGLEPACVKTCPTNAISWGSKDDMLALADQKIETLKARGYDNAAVYNPAGVGGTHMMYVVPHGDRLEDYSLPPDPTASPTPMTGHATLTKLYGSDPEAEKRYSPAKCLGCKTKTVSGDPNPKHISTSYVERQNLTMRMSLRRFTRLTNAFSKKVENHAAAVALYFMYYNFVRIHQTLRTTPAQAAGVTGKLWEVEDMVGLLPH